MAHWGEAMTLAPNLNAPMTPENAPAGARGDRARPGGCSRGAERHGARAHRGAGDAGSPPIRRRRARRSIAPTPRRWRGSPPRYPVDPDVQTLYADAVMNTMPWDYWQKDGVAEAGDRDR